MVAIHGVNMVFNAAMNSIPVLLLAIGVDYGLHVVLRIREEMQNLDIDDSIERKDNGRFFLTRLGKCGTKRDNLNFGALIIAIFTDIVGFLSFSIFSLIFLTSIWYCNAR